MAKQLYPGIPFIYDDNDHIVGIKNPGGSIFNFVLSVPDDTTPVDGVQATLTSNMTNANSDLILTAVNYGGDANLISITYVNPSANSQALDVLVNGTNIIVNLATNGSGTITSTANQVKAALDADSRVAALVTVAVDGTGAGVVNALAKAYLTGGVNTTPGPVGCLCFAADNSIIYRKTDNHTWTAVAAAPAP